MPRKSSKRNRLGRAKDRAKKKSSKKKVPDKKSVSADQLSSLGYPTDYASDVKLGSADGAADLVRSSLPRPVVSPRKPVGGFANMPDTDPFRQRNLAAPSNRMSSGGKVGSKGRDGIASRGFTRGRFV